MQLKPKQYCVYLKLKYSEMNERTWMENIWIVFFVWLTSLKSGIDLSNKLDIKDSYKTFLHQTKDQFDYFGVLTTNYLLGAAVLLDFVLLKFIHCFHDTNQIPGVKCIIENHGILSEMNKMNEFNDFLDSFYWKVTR